MNSSGDNQTMSVLTSKLSPTADIWVGLIILIIVVLSVLGNGLVLLVSYCSRSKIVGWEVLCINLALADFFCCILFYPLSISSSFQHTWLGGSASCTYYGFGCYVFNLCSVLTITAISGLRYLKICHCSVYTEWIKRANIQRACCFIWLVATVWSSFPLVGWSEYVPEPYGLSCTVAWRSFHASAKDAFYMVCSFSLFTLIPFLLIVVSQCQIVFALSRLSSQMSQERIRNRLKRTEKQLSWMFFCISLSFVVTWLPYTIVYFIFIFKGHQYMPPGSFVFPALFAKSSHVYNPFIYFYFNKDFRKKVWHLFCNFRVGQEEVVDIGFREGERSPPPIDIQLQDRSRPQNKKSVSRDNSKGSNRSEARAEEGSGSHQSIQAVRTCWDFTLEKNTAVVSETEPAQVSTLV